MYAEGPFSVQYDLPDTLREWEAGSMTVRVTVPEAPEGKKPVLLARVVPPSEDAFRFAAGMCQEASKTRMSGEARFSESHCVETNRVAGSMAWGMAVSCSCR